MDRMDSTEEEVKKEKNLNFKKMLLWLFGLGLTLMLIAYLGGYITVGGPNKGGRFGVISPEDSAAVVKSDTIKVQN